MCRTVAMGVGERFLQGVLERFTLLAGYLLRCSLFLEDAVYPCMLTKVLAHS